MKKRKGIVLMVVLLLFLLTGGVVVYFAQKNNVPTEEEQTEESDVRTFADWTDTEVFQNVPAMLVADTKIGEAVDYGAENYVIDVTGSSLEAYKDYLVLLEENGFEKYVDNGEQGLAEAVYTSTYTKDNLVLTVTHVINIEKTYISACFDAPLSEHLIYNEKYVSGNVDGAKTKIHMLELYDYGNSFIIELKNGHFVVMDGGQPEDGKYLLDYLESLVAEGEKPIIEAWMFSHAHMDHVGAFTQIATSTSDASRIYVEEIYFNQPSDAVVGACEPGVRAQIQNVSMAPLYFKTTDGKMPNIYRTQTGQRYYFNDFTIDIVMAQEQMLLTNYSGDFNDSSTWLMLTLEGQKCLFGGDGDVGNIENVMRTYGEDYLVLDIFQALHHSLNTRNDFTDYCTAMTVLTAAPKLTDTKENKYLTESVSEVLGWEDGAKVLTFPYQVGTAEKLPNIEWIYNPEKEADTAE